MSTEQSLTTVDIHDRVADAYYGKMGKVLQEQTQKRINWICSQVRGQAVMDVGCSQGIVPILLAREGCDVLGVDIDPLSIEEAGKLLSAEPEHTRQRVNYINKDFLRSDINKQFDAVLMTEVLEHLVRPEEFVDKAYELLNESGLLIITLPFGINDYIDHKKTYYMFEACDLVSKYFEIESIKFFGKWFGLVAKKSLKEESNSTEWMPTKEHLGELERAFNQIERELVSRLEITLESLNNANAKYRSVIQQNNAFKQEIETIRQLKAEAEQSLKKHADKEAVLLTELKTLKDEFGALFDQEEAANSQLIGLKKNLEELKLEKAETESRLQELRGVEAHSETVNKKVDQLVKIRAKLETDLEAISQELAQTKDKYILAVNSKADIDTQLAKMEVCCGYLEESVDQGKQRESQLKKRADDLSKALEDLKEESYQVKLENGSFKYELEKKEIEIKDKNLAIEQLTLTAKKLEVELKALSASLLEHELLNKSHVTEHERADQELKNLATQNKELRDQHNDALDALAENSRIISRLNKENNDIEKDKKILSEFNKALKKDIGQALDEADNNRRTIEQLQKDKEHVELLYKNFVDNTHDLYTAYGTVESELSRNLTELEELQGKLEVLLGKSEKQERELEAIKLEISNILETTGEELTALEQQLIHSSQQVQELQDTNTKIDSDKKIIAKELEQKDLELVSTQEKLDAANKKYSDVTSTQIPELKTKLQTMHQQHRDNHKAILALKNELRAERQRRIKAESQAVKARSTISFQLGYALIFGTKSIKDFVKLPAKLWDIHKQSLERKQKNVLPAPTPENSAIQLNTKPTVSDCLPQQISTLESAPKLKTEKAIKEIKVACVMDEFTYGSYSPECDLQQLTPENWNEELDSFSPDFLFIESAWRGVEEKWGNKVGHNSTELQGIIKWCNERAIPTLFWNKEDPVHFETFLNVAKQFDYVFTTDMDCIHRYKGALGHERVYFLPFACQPVLHNPIEKFQRKDGFCFAGAYYVRYPDRTKDLESFVAELPDFKPLEIYDRNYGKDDPNYQFPSEYQPYIVGTLPFEQIDKAYKGYRYAINLNSIKQSQTMFARRVYELLASNTVTISNFSRGVRLLFGDLVQTSDSGEEIRSRLEAFESRPFGYEKLRLAGLRKVLQEHTYEDRLQYVVSKLSGKDVEPALPEITVVGVASSRQSALQIISMYTAQTYAKRKLVVLRKGRWSLKSIPDDQEVSFIDYKKASSNNLAQFCPGCDFISYFNEHDYYGPNYLKDLALSTRYSGATVIAKAPCFHMESNCLKTVVQEKGYTISETAPIRCSLFSLATAQDITVSEVFKNEDFTLRVEEALTVDPFNYCRAAIKNGHMKIDIRETVDDLGDVDQGIGLPQLIDISEKIKPAIDIEVSGEVLEPDALISLIKPGKNSLVAIAKDELGLLVTSKIEDGKHEYIYANKDFTLQELGVEGDEIKLHLETTPGLNLQWVVFYIDENKQKISHAIKPANCNITLEAPLGTKWLRFGLRVYAGGASVVKRLSLGHKALQPPKVIGSSDYLILTNHYPSYDNLYRNGFVHTRVKAYAEEGIAVDVFRLQNYNTLSYSEFKHVDVLTGNQNALRALLENNCYKNVLVHFLDASMWEVLKDFEDKIRVTVWVHGAEIQPWWRREYNYRTAAELEAAKVVSEQRLGFWKELLSRPPEMLRLIFVSRYFAEEVMEDIGFELPEEVYDIIHNPIDTDLFTYEEKHVDQRKKILSIRPYASAKYANDLSVKAILQLSKESWFKELDIKMIGDGILFDETLEPLIGFDNVDIERGFLTQQQIAKLHKEYGIFLCPTRMDAQGVSKDEAMSSGLIPITNGVTAIPEFVDESCGILAAGDDYMAMAEGIKRLILNPEEFAEKSAAAAKRVRKQTAKRIIVDQEIKVIKSS